MLFDFVMSSRRAETREQINREEKALLFEIKKQVAAMQSAEDRPAAELQRQQLLEKYKMSTDRLKKLNYRRRQELDSFSSVVQELYSFASPFLW